ncbi:MAG: gene transfer agent family protein [Hyphomicrobiaceae bacterium]|nr:gene transfer agent family protein [Hyphomicrobiaceae bacterium]
MANTRRGEIDAVLDGRRYRLCLTLGALAELEACFDDEDMLALAVRFESGRISARDAQRVIGAGLRGGGSDVSDDDVARMQAEGGVAGFIDIVARLLEATFCSEDREDECGRKGGSSATGKGRSGAAGGEVAEQRGPFPGPT